MIASWLAFHEAFQGRRLHLGVTGSISAYKMPDVVRSWQDAGLSISVTLTEAAQRFIGPLTFSALGAAPVYTALFDDREAPSPFAHLEPGQVADAFVVAPASASTLARLAAGQADEILCCQALAFGGRARGRNGGLVLAPAMNPAMWAHPATQANVATLRERGCRVVEPGLGRTACGEEGQGRLADTREIFLAGLRALSPQDMAGQRLLLTVGPTREPWDGLRFWSNPSSGVMGAAVAVAAWLRGAEVDAVCGPGVPWLPRDVRRHEVRTADEMFQAADALWDAADVGVFSAAVADFAPERNTAGKFSKSEAPDGFSVRFRPTRDILRTLAARRRAEQRVVGFAAQAGDLESSVRKKLHSKKADMVVGNLLQDGFATSENRVFVADAHGREEHWPALPKPDVAWRILSWLLA